jgi:hypothetical protein
MDARTKRVRIFKSDCFMDEHDDCRLGAVDGQFAEMGQHYKIRYAIMLNMMVYHHA